MIIFVGELGWVKMGGCILWVGRGGCTFFMGECVWVDVNFGGVGESGC